MRRCVLAICLVLAACTAEPGPDPTSSTLPPMTSTVDTVPPVASTDAPATTSGATTTTLATSTSTLSLDETTLAYQAVAELDFPVQLTARPGDPLSYVITKDGRVWVFDGSVLAEQPVLDISAQVRNDGEQGLLSMALHSEDVGRFYLHYSDGNGDTVVSEFAFASPTQADPASERVLLQVGQPASNHNGGMLQFLPDGALLLGLGDGGGGGDRFGNGQNPDTLLGGQVALNVDDADPAPAKYSMGLRNPWRFWIDGELTYVADVGQNAFEEISVAPLQAGHNFGWPIAEGLHCFQTDPCDTTGQVIPVHEVGHGDAGTCSITGGIVYRGPAIPQLSGHYFFSDYCGGYLRSLLYADGAATDLRDWTDQVGVPGQVTGFGVDGSGEMYVTTTGQVLKVVPAGG